MIKYIDRSNIKSIIRENIHEDFYNNATLTFYIVMPKFTQSLLVNTIKQNAKCIHVSCVWNDQKI